MITTMITSCPASRELGSPYPAVQLLVDQHPVAPFLGVRKLSV